MRNLMAANINKYRLTNPEIIELYGSIGDDDNGAFLILSPVNPNRSLRVIASKGKGWDHVSVSLEDRCPTWEEMDFIFRVFFKEDEVAMQLHVPLKEHINHHPNCLHIWRPLLRVKIPRPPDWMVGPRGEKS